MNTVVRCSVADCNKATQQILCARGSRPACKLMMHIRKPWHTRTLLLRCLSSCWCSRTLLLVYLQGWGQGGFYGPPYALLQGSLADIAEQPPFEGSPPVKRGVWHSCTQHKIL
jgi:hypothetical protein